MYLSEPLGYRKGKGEKSNRVIGKIRVLKWNTDMKVTEIQGSEIRPFWVRVGSFTTSYILLLFKKILTQGYVY